MFVLQFTAFALLLPAALGGTSTGRLASDCFLDGECLDSTFINAAEAQNRNDCHEICKRNEGCQWFTYNDLEHICYLFEDCTELSTDTCVACVSGDVNCSEPLCMEPGVCQGTEIGKNADVDTSYECLDICKLDFQCEWFTYLESLRLCLLFSNCETFDEGDTNGISGQSKCPETAEMKTIVISGANSAAYRDVELLYLEGANFTCFKPQDYPLDIYAHSTVLYKRKLTVCGGIAGSYQASCYQLDASDNSWKEMLPMTSARGFFAAVTTPYGIMLTGGYDGSSAFNTFEYFNGDAWQPGPPMPTTIRYHCAVQLNSTHTAVIGGERSNVYVFDWTQQVWSEVQPMHEVRSLHSCVMLPNGNVFVAGDDTSATGLTTEVYDPIANQWLYGPPLPFDSYWYYGALVLADEKPTLVGGVIDGSVDDRVFQLVGHEWVQLETTLQIGRQSHTATRVPVESLPACTETTDHL